MRKYGVIQIFQDGGRGYSVVPVSYLLMPLYSDGQNLPANQISLLGLNSWLRYNYFRLEKQTSNILEFYSRFRFRLCPTIGMLVCIRLPHFMHRPAIAEIWRHVDFSRWRTRPLNTTSDFVFVHVTAFRRSKSISLPNFIDISQFTAAI